MILKNHLIAHDAVCHAMLISESEVSLLTDGCDNCQSLLTDGCDYCVLVFISFQSCDQYRMIIKHLYLFFYQAIIMNNIALKKAV